MDWFLHKNIDSSLDVIAADYDENIRRILSERRDEILPVGLLPFSSKGEIAKKARELTDDIKDLIDLHEATLEQLWESLCKYIQQPVCKVPDLSRISLYKAIKKILTKSVKRATFVFQSIVKICHTYVDYQYTDWLKDIRLKNNSGFYEHALEISTYPRSNYRKQYNRTAGYLARSTGMTSLALKDGLEAYFVTITLKRELHRNSKNWDGTTPEQAAKKITSSYSALYQRLRNNNINLESIRIVESDKGGTPHLHLMVLTDTPDKVESAIRKQFVTTDGLSEKKGIYFKKVRSVKATIRYLLKSFWGPYHFRDGNDDELIAWSKSLGVRRFAITSFMRKYPTVELWDDARKGRAAIENCSSPLVISYGELRDGESYVESSNTRYIDLYDVTLNVNLSLNKIATDGDYAQFTRIFSTVTKTRKRPAVQRREGLSTISSLDETELRTISQDSVFINHNVLSNIRDIKDFWWLLRRKLRKKTERQCKSDIFMKEFFDSAMI